MDKYISKEYMLSSLEKELEHKTSDSAPLTELIIQRFIQYVEEFPVVDTPKEQLGRWEDPMYDDMLNCWTATCYCCGASSTDCLLIVGSHKYCEHCGAKMEEAAE